MKKRKPWSLILIIILSIIFVVACLFFLHKGKITKVAYKANLTTIRKIPDLTESGKVHAKKIQQLKIPKGTISKVNVRNGQSVIKNDILLTTHDEEAESQLSLIEQKIQKNQRSILSQNTLVNALQKKLDSVGNSNDELKTQLVQEQNNLADLQVDLTLLQNQHNEVSSKINQTLVAPFDGIINLNDTKLGQPELTLHSHELEVQTTISEYDYNKATVDDQVNIFDLSNKTVKKGKIQFIAKTPSDTNKKNFSLYKMVVQTNDNFMEGQSVSVSVPQSGYKVPLKGIQKKKENYYIYKVDKHRIAHMIKVNAIKKDSFYIVNNGLKHGDIIIVNPTNKIIDGTEVKSS